MIRRLLLAASAVLLAGSAALPVLAADSLGPIVENQHYLKVPIPSAPVDPRQITVEEFFWYGCPHCARLEPRLAEWRKTLAKDVVYTPVPNSLGRPEGVVHQQAYYIATTLGIEDRIRRPLFDALVVNRIPLYTLPAIRDFFVQTAGVKPSDFDSVASSFMVDSAVRRADQLSKDYRITGTPQIVVGGKYLTEIGLPAYRDVRYSEGEKNGQMLDVVDQLIVKVRAERSGK
jgi:thiol:disulfide interchange protein DsbA